MQVQICEASVQKIQLKEKYVYLYKSMGVLSKEKLHHIRVGVSPTSKVPLGEEVLDEVCVSGEEQVVQLVHTHAERVVDVQPPAQVGAERLHFTWKYRRRKNNNRRYKYFYLLYEDGQ